MNFFHLLELENSLLDLYFLAYLILHFTVFWPTHLYAGADNATYRLSRYFYDHFFIDAFCINILYQDQHQVQKKSCIGKNGDETKI